MDGNQSKIWLKRKKDNKKTANKNQIIWFLCIQSQILEKENCPMNYIQSAGKGRSTDDEAWQEILKKHTGKLSSLFGMELNIKYCLITISGALLSERICWEHGEWEYVGNPENGSCAKPSLRELQT